MINGFFQLEIRKDGTYLIVYPPAPGGTPCDPSEILKYLDIYQVDYDKIAIYNLMKAPGDKKELRITAIKVSSFDETVDIEITDNFRFKIIAEDFNRSQAFSQTTDVKYYNIRSVGGYPPVKIIDTPGYGDTRGITRDKEITAQIKILFKEKISTLNAVCFVTKSSNNRLTHPQRYILSSILDLFGEDVKEIFVFMLTFCDGGKPNIIEPLQEENCPFSKIISLLKNQTWYYKFNNSAIFEDNREDEFTQMFWKLGMKNFVEFKKKT